MVVIAAALLCFCGSSSSGDAAGAVSLKSSQSAGCQVMVMAYRAVSEGI